MFTTIRVGGRVVSGIYYEDKNSGHNKNTSRLPPAYQTSDMGGGVRIIWQNSIQALARVDNPKSDFS